MTLQLVKRTLNIAGHDISFELPASQDQLLEVAIRSEISGLADSDPYWGSLWDASPKTAEMVLKHHWPASLNVLELGCGIGVTGIAALFAGHDVTFSDHASAAVELAVRNAALNGFVHANGKVFDWLRPPASFQYDLIIGSDLLYDTANHQRLLNTIQQMLKIDGIAWLGEPGRANAEPFVQRAGSQGWTIETIDEYFQPIRIPQRLQFRLYLLQPPAADTCAMEC